MPTNEERALTLPGKGLILLAVALAYASNFWPGKLVLGAGLNALGNPAYSGFTGAFLPHLLLYSTVEAVISALLWALLVRAGLLPPPKLGNPRAGLLFGAIGGVLALVLMLSAAFLSLPAGTIHWIDPAPWKIAGNLFSNFFEEFVFRGFLLVGLRRVAGFWPAAIVSSILWALQHTQFPLLMQVAVAIVGVLFCLLARRAKSLWAPYVAHELLDLVGDILIG